MRELTQAEIDLVCGNGSFGAYNYNGQLVSVFPGVSSYTSTMIYFEDGGMESLADLYANPSALSYTLISGSPQQLVGWSDYIARGGGNQAGGGGGGN